MTQIPNWFSSTDDRAEEKINEIIDYLTAREEELIPIIKGLSHRIDTIAVNQQVQAQHIQNLRGGWTDVEIRASSLKKEPTEPYFPQMCWCGEVDCMGVEVEVGGKVHRPDHPCYELPEADQPQDQPKRHREADIMFALSSATGFDGEVDEDKFFDLLKPIVAIIEREATEAYKAKLLADNQQ